MTPRQGLLERLQRGDRVVGDGAWGTMLIDRGLPPGAAPESWTLARPDVITAIGRAYLDAGAEIITTNTFGGSRFRLAPQGLHDAVSEVNRRGVHLAAAVAQDRAYVSASIGPSGLVLQPYGDADPARIADGFEEQALALASAGADLFCVETMTDAHEAALAIGAVRRVAPSATVIATMTFDITPRGPYTVMGVSVAEAARALEGAGADVVGANCGSGVEAMLEVARALSAQTTLPIAIRANAGLPVRRRGRLLYPDSPQRYASTAVRMLDHGVRVIGGCCGTTPDHIRALAALMAPRST
jgi:5-methyltetrahydrofolate--homocysteine methyltransferase